jgi:hypothetical protein
MILGFYENDFFAYITLGIIMNFTLSLLFGMYMSNNIGMSEMLMSSGKYKQTFIVKISILVPFAKSLITLYRIAILQFYFLNQGKTHKDYWVYLTNN